MMRSRNKTIAFAAAFTALGLILGYIDSLIMIPVRVPGVRTGISNIVTVVTLCLYGPLFSFAVLTVRLILSAILFGSPVSFIYSACGGAVALTGMILMKRMGFSVYGMSVTGAVLHNIAQIIVALFLVGSGYIALYLPVLILAGVFAGLVVGFLSDIIITRLKKFIIKGEREGDR